MIIIYTDGASRGNPGPGGWAAIVFDKDKVKEIGGKEEKTTNNRMEMKAAAESLKSISEGIEVEVYTDSSYLLNGITKWVYGWQANGWLTKLKEEVLNKDLWQELIEEASKREVEWRHVSGHSGHSYNNRCDEIATGFADRKLVKLYEGSRLNYKVEEKYGAGVNRSKAKAYSYVSMIEGEVQTHKTWKECEDRVKEIRGARYRKSLSEEDEREIIKIFKE